jgi:uncharacterized SAM-binding protein YcdF (DUF218 family)
MMFILSKLLSFLTQPFIWILGLLIWAWLTKRAGLRKWLLIVSACLGFLFSNQFILNQVVKGWEVSPKHYSELKGPYDYAIVLGGMASFDNEYDRIRFNGASDRLWQSVDLYKKGIIRGFILSGGSSSVLHPEDREMVFLKDYLLELGIPQESILSDTLSRNTRENAKNVKNNFYVPGKKYLLVTSAIHMRRALACFRQEGIPVASFSADVVAPIKNRFNPGSLLPSAGALGGWEAVMHEMIGYMMYDILGYF